MNDARRILKPAPDSQYRLRPCKACGGDCVAYVEYEHPEGPPLRWRVVCYDCGNTVDVATKIRHTAQIEWNRRQADGLF